MHQHIENQENEEALREFLLDIDCLEPLKRRNNKFNLFDILGIVRAELRHSNMLAWLMTPDENHGLEEKFLREIIYFYVRNYAPSEAFKLLSADHNTFVVRREWNNIDVFAVSEEEKIVLAIENKVDTSEHSDQLNRYRNIIDDHYDKSYTKIYLFLTKEGLSSSDPKRWKPLKYGEIVDMLQKLCSSVKIPDDSRFLINNYIDVIERFIVDDQKLRDECVRIYLKHRKAIDLIVENIPNPIHDAHSAIESWLNNKHEPGEIIYYSGNSNKNYHRFKTKRLQEMFPEEALKAYRGRDWREHFYFYEIVNNKEGIFSQLAILKTNAPAEVENKIQFISENYSVVPRLKDYIVAYKTADPLDNSQIKISFDVEELEHGLNQQFDELMQFEDEFIQHLNVNFSGNSADFNG